MSQLIELIWRNKRYTEGTRDPDVAFPDRKGAMFAGFSTEMGFENETGKPSKKPRQEHASYDRVCVYPGTCMDNKYSYAIGPQHGSDPASLDLPHILQVPRTVKTDVFSYKRQIDRVRNDGSTTNLGPENYHAIPEQGTALYPPDENGHPHYFKEPGMTIRKRGKFSSDSSATVDLQDYSTLGFIDDIDYANAGDTNVAIDLNESIAGVTAVLKKVVIQMSKENHHISEVVIDFSDITRGSGSISSSSNPQSNMLTIMLDGKSKLHEAFFDCKMGKFGASKFKLGIADVNYFPPMSCAAGGFDAGSQVAVPGDIYMSCERKFDTPSSTLHELQGQFKDDQLHSWPNPARGVPDPTKYVSSGSTLVRDAVNSGFRMDGTGSLTATDSAGTAAQRAACYGSVTNAIGTQLGTTQRNSDNLITTSDNGTTAITGTVNHQWMQPGVSTYSFKPRETRGTLLAVNVVLQADSNTF